MFVAAERRVFCNVCLQTLYVDTAMVSTVPLQV